MKKKEWGYEFTVRNQLSDLFLLISREVEHVYREQEQHESKNLQRTRRMVDYVQTHCAEPITLEQIAGAASISTRECMRCFQSILGVSPKQYLIRLRIQKACRLLEHSEMRLLDIGETCGFQDQSYFSKIFHRETGCSPREYRKEKQKRNQEGLL